MIQGESFRLRQKKTGVLGRHIATTGTWIDSPPGSFGSQRAEGRKKPGLQQNLWVASGSGS